MEGRFAGRVALVTGGSRGLGRAIALALAGEGADVAVLARDGAQLEDVATAVQELGRGACALPCDLADGPAITRAFATVHDVLGPIDILVNNAALVTPMGRMLALDPDLWSRTLAINLTGAFLCFHAALPAMLAHGWGRVVNISSAAARPPGIPSASAYSVSKAGLDMLTASLAVELAGSGVTVNAVWPGVIDTGMQTEIRSQPEERVGAEVVRLFEGFQASGILQDPARLARLVVNLLAGDSTGEVVDIADPRGLALLNEI